MLSFRCLVAVSAVFGATAAPLVAATLTADTSRPNTSTFVIGEKVSVVLNAAGLTPLSSSTLSIDVRDEHGVSVAKASIAVAASSDGTWNGEYAPPCDKLGFYRLFPSLADGTTISKLFTRPNGYLTYAVVPDPSTRLDYGEDGSLFGMNGRVAAGAGYIVPYLGVRWLFNDYSWDHREKWHSGQFAQAIAAAKPRDEHYPAGDSVTYDGKPWRTHALAMMRGVPDWASDPAVRGPHQAPILPAAEDDYKAYCEAVAKDFEAIHPDENSRLYQITAEPIYPWGYKGTDRQLVRIYELAYPAIHKEDTRARILGPTDFALGGDDPAWTDRLLSAGLDNYLDGVSIDAYFPLPPERNGMIKAIDDLKDVIRKHLGHDLPLYETEQGYATKEDPSKELLQAQGLIRQNLIYIGEGFKFSMTFSIADYSAEPGFGYYYNLHPGKDYVTDKISPKPVVPAYAAMTYLIDGHRPTERIDWLAPTALGYSFDHDGDIVLAVWDYGDKPSEVSIPVGTKQVTVYDWMGNATSVASPGGVLKITLTPDPVYIKGASAALWGADRPMRVSPRSDGLPGVPITINAHLLAAASAISGSLTLTLDKRLAPTPIVKPVALAKGGQADVAIISKLASDAEPGSYVATVVLKAKDGQTLAGCGTRINILPPIVVSTVSPQVAGTQYSVDISVKNLLPQQVNGSIATRLAGVPGTRLSMPFALSGGESRVIKGGSFDADILPSKIYKVIVSVRTSAGYEFEQAFPVDFLQAPKLLSPPTIDADLSKWAKVRGVVLAGRDAVVLSPNLWKGDDDLSAIVKYGWDDNALYLAVDETDDVFCQEQTGFDTWNGDCVQIGVDIDSGKKVIRSGNDFADKGSGHRWSEITLALTKNGTEAYRTGSYDISLFKVAPIPLSKIPCAIVRQGVHTLYETAIPWRMLGKIDKPRIGDRIGVALSVNDRDDPREKNIKAIGLFGGIVGHKQVDDYGVLTLGPQQ
ncbi:MAG: sugar-binding protein [Capsulimonadaceae bacterium]|nr:sugar-binding protein [Capsulimonadaceae bacterium]